MQNQQELLSFTKVKYLVVFISSVFQHRFKTLFKVCSGFFSTCFYSVYILLDRIKNYHILNILENTSTNSTRKSTNTTNNDYRTNTSEDDNIKCTTTYWADNNYKTDKRRCENTTEFMSTNIDST